ncbi:bifunctional diaminohydroxyphosphoribosylaminopyrimidine deaminase/5-amino-6-(5-phosphoribosylamino)uracil reductase RibD [Suttonella sp. R2A3]|uniref:bifunctional diaminohydroxyphosphoribosylaminopyrimidine deaminase/5-amino-6-(5-phosphoribosylamino)uracil reductase RibD n=1 Tax=Suttonella sp. R2A3 TaxID=2908648 RepID=UPI001F01809A|nr:bifunctional diaminohydroxyphosphoribosylaminopyrimidine deaminase/5-amino-6-(5-phosphoribosylamino)uracil reductase RibD [Suttonella sp. R2A3]UJF25378.1 bifunctional diaminohydroxyphosphoribosylaminopyrimidine deaminase/5-amino-6-(5-phosphoribosylamino)uracil reductase RibD [Suttonella sp. R2A3]
MDNDVDYMRRAIALAKRGIFSAAPNPAVGCVLVKNNRIIGEGFHERTGEAHAEVHALKQAGVAAKDATAYVTLEPCAHHGRTPPCTDALIASGVKRVVIACIDPNPQVHGKGISLLEDAGITVTVGVLADEALAINRGFFHRYKEKRPYVRVKIAASLDGKTALPSGESQWISSAESLLDSHYWRLRSDAIIAGCGSVIDDNARLNARYPTELASNQPLKIVIDSQLRTPIDAAIFDDGTPVILATTDKAAHKSYPEHAEILRLPANAQGKVDLSALLDELGRRQINSVWVEAGAGLAAAFTEQRLFQEIVLYFAPTFLGEGSRGMMPITPPTSLSAKMALQISEGVRIGEDWRFTLTAKP